MDCSRYRGARLARKKCDFYDRRRRDPTRYAYTLSWQLAKVTDALGNETEITKERRGLEQESGSCTYGYDALGRLSEIQKDGQMQTRYGYDAFGNRTWIEESGERTSYQYNVINQMVSEKHGETLRAYSYDKRGNLTSIQENGAWKKQYVYGAINRLEEAVDAAGKQARYQYNGLGHRVGKQEGVLPKEKLEKLAPQSRIGMEIGNSRQITYTLDLTRQYYNLLERTEESRSQRYFWDGNVAAYEENGERNYYLQDELGSPLRIEDSAGNLRESYGYGVFGEDLYQNQGKIQPFGYTGYQRDEVSGTYYAQAREYLAENGRFAGQDLIAGFMDLPFSMNRYSYCFNASMVLVDLDGAFPSWSDIRNGIGKAWNWAKKHKDDIIKVGITALGIGVVGGLSVITGGAAGAILSSIAWGAAGGAVIGGIGESITGGNFANGFVGGAISGGIGAGIGGIAQQMQFTTKTVEVLMTGFGDFIGGVTGSLTSTLLDGAELTIVEGVKIGLNGMSQAIMGGTIGRLFSTAAKGVDKIGRATLNYFKSVYDVGGSVVLEALFAVLFPEQSETTDKVTVQVACTLE